MISKSETCLNRQKLNNYVKRKVMDVLCERQTKEIYKEIQSQDFYIPTYKDIKNISRNNHKARSYQLLSLPTNTEEIHEV